VSPDKLAGSGRGLVARLRRGAHYFAEPLLGWIAVVAFVPVHAHVEARELHRWLEHAERQELCERLGDARADGDDQVRCCDYVRREEEVRHRDCHATARSDRYVCHAVER